LALAFYTMDNHDLKVWTESKSAWLHTCTDTQTDRQTDGRTHTACKAYIKLKTNQVNRRTDGLSKPGVSITWTHSLNIPQTSSKT